MNGTEKWNKNILQSNVVLLTCWKTLTIYFWTETLKSWGTVVVVVHVHVVCLLLLLGWQRAAGCCGCCTLCSLLSAAAPWLLRTPHTVTVSPCVCVWYWIVLFSSLFLMKRLFRLCSVCSAWKDIEAFHSQPI